MSIKKIALLMLLAFVIAFTAFGIGLGPRYLAYQNLSCGSVKYYTPAQDDIDFYENESGDGMIWGYDASNGLLAGGWITDQMASNATVIIQAVDGLNEISVTHPEGYLITVTPLVCNGVMYELMTEPVIVEINVQPGPSVPTLTPPPIHTVPAPPNNHG